MKRRRSSRSPLSAPTPSSSPHESVAVAGGTTQTTTEIHKDAVNADNRTIKRARKSPSPSAQDAERDALEQAKHRRNMLLNLTRCRGSEEDEYGGCAMSDIFVTTTRTRKIFAGKEEGKDEPRKEPREEEAVDGDEAREEKDTGGGEGEDIIVSRNATHPDDLDESSRWVQVHTYTCGRCGHAVDTDRQAWQSLNDEWRTDGVAIDVTTSGVRAHDTMSAMPEYPHRLHEPIKNRRDRAHALGCVVRSAIGRDQETAIARVVQTTRDQARAYRATSSLERGQSRQLEPTQPAQPAQSAHHDQDQDTTSTASVAAEKLCRHQFKRGVRPIVTFPEFEQLFAVFVDRFRSNLASLGGYVGGGGGPIPINAIWAFGECASLRVVGGDLVESRKLSPFRIDRIPENVFQFNDDDYYSRAILGDMRGFAEFQTDRLLRVLYFYTPSEDVIHHPAFDFVHGLPNRLRRLVLHRRRFIADRLMFGLAFPHGIAAMIMGYATTALCPVLGEPGECDDGDGGDDECDLGDDGRALGDECDMLCFRAGRPVSVSD